MNHIESTRNPKWPPEKEVPFQRKRSYDVNALLRSCSRQSLQQKQQLKEKERESCPWPREKEKARGSGRGIEKVKVARK